MAESTSFKSSFELLDEHSREDFRKVYGQLLASSERLDAALRRLRLGGVDLSPNELKKVRRIRLVVAELNGITLAGEADAMSSDPVKARRILLFLRMLRTGRLEVRTAPLGGWYPDFSVFHAAGRSHVLLGLHWFQRPFPHRGPALAVHLAGGQAELAGIRFEELWTGSYDVSRPVRRILGRSLERAQRPHSLDHAQERV